MSTKTKTATPSKKLAVPKAPKVPKPGSALEEALLLQIRAARLPEPVTNPQHKPVPGRRWALDISWPSVRVGVEVMGSTWTGGRHTRGAGYQADCEKANECALRGWIVLRVTREHVESGQALAWVERLLAAVGATVKIA